MPEIYLYNRREQIINTRMDNPAGALKVVRKAKYVDEMNQWR
jgi:hypothetical protein